MRREILGVTFCLCVAGPALGQDARELLTEGKLEADMGNRSAAEAAFTAAAADEEGPAVLRAEALVRLGVLRRDAGDARGSIEAFERSFKEYGQDKDSLRLLVHAVAGSLPGQKRWDAIWQRIVVKVDHSAPAIHVEWPDVPPAARTYTEGPPLSLDFKDGQLVDIFRLFADISQRNVVVHPGVSGHVTIQVNQIPWDQALDLVLSPNGLAANRVGNLIEIGPPKRLGTRRHFDGDLIDIDHKGTDLVSCLENLAAKGGKTLTIDSSVQGQVTIMLQRVPWDQAFDVIARLNGLTWKAEGRSIRVGKSVQAE